MGFYNNYANNNDRAYCQKVRNKEKIHNKSIKTTVMVVMLTLICIAALTSCTGSNKINPLNYISVSFEGYNEHGIPEIEFDEYDLICEVIGEEPYGTTYFDWEEKYLAFDEGISVTFNPETKLKNGDKFVVSITTTGKAAEKISSCEKEYTVAGLIELSKVDIFEDIELTFEGVSGDARAIIEKSDNSDVAADCSFSVDPMYNLSNGDIVTIQIKNIDELAEHHNILPMISSKEYTVSGLNSYVSSVDEIPQALIQSLAERFAQEEKADLQENAVFSYSDVKYYGTYLLMVKEDAWLSHHNELQIFISYDEYMNGEFWRTIYLPLVFENVLKTPDGIISLEYEDGNTSIFTTDIDGYIEEIKDKYEVMSIETK